MVDSRPARSHRGCRSSLPAQPSCTATLSALVARQRALRFEWLEGGDAANTPSLLRWDNDGKPHRRTENFSGNPSAPTGSPALRCEWEEILNTDAAEYGGSGVGNVGTVHATDTPHGGRPASAEPPCRPSRAVAAFEEVASTALVS